MATKRGKRQSSLPVLLALGSLVVLILLLGFYFANCVNKTVSMLGDTNVLGISNFSTSASKNPVGNGESFSYTSTVSTDQTGLVNGTLLFQLSGSGAITGDPQGPGTCLRITNTTAACNNVNINANESSSWTIPASANGNCIESSPASVSLNARLVGPVGTFTSDTTVNCAVSSNPTATPTPSSGGGNNNPTPTSTSNSNNTTTTGSTTTTGTTNGNGGGGSGSGNQQGTGATSKTAGSGEAVSPSAINIAGLACSKVSGFPTVFILFILWLIATAYYFLIRKKN